MIIVIDMSPYAIILIEMRLEYWGSKGN